MYHGLRYLQTAIAPVHPRVSRIGNTRKVSDYSLPRCSIAVLFFQEENLTSAAIKSPALMRGSRH